MNDRDSQGFFLESYYLRVTLSSTIFVQRARIPWQFPGGLVVRTWHFHHCSLGSIPGLGTEILYQVATCCDQKKKKKPLYVGWPTIFFFWEWKGWKKMLNWMGPWHNRGKVGLSWENWLYGHPSYTAVLPDSHPKSAWRGLLLHRKVSTLKIKKF